MLFFRVQILAHPAQIQPQKENTKERKKTPSADAVSSPKVFTINMFTPSMTTIETHKNPMPPLQQHIYAYDH